MKGYELMFFCLKKTISNICINIPFKFYFFIKIKFKIILLCNKREINSIFISFGNI